MTTNPPFNLPGPGLPQQAYLDLLAADHQTGWWDDDGVPAPWPEEFLDPRSGWQPAGGGDHDPTNPDQPPF